VLDLYCYDHDPLVNLKHKLNYLDPCCQSVKGKIGSVKGKMNDSKQGRDGIHDKETHGRSGDIDENTSPQKIKAPNLIERAKEEVKALVIAIHHPNKDHHHQTNGILHSSTGVYFIYWFQFCLFTV
jgi:hypothetical protein